MQNDESLSYSKSGVNIDETDAVKRDMASNIGRGDSGVLNKLGANAGFCAGCTKG